MATCDEDLMRYAQSLGLTSEQILGCFDQTAKDLGISSSEVCESVRKKVNNIINDTLAATSKKGMALHSYQERALRYMFNHRGLVVAFGVGAGKTLTAATISHVLVEQARVFGQEVHVHIVTPTSLQDNFKKEMKAAGFKITSNYHFYTITGFANAFNKGQIECLNSLLIVDEAHNLKMDYRGEFGTVKISKEASARVTRFIACARNAWKVVLLTATPQYNATHDIVNLVAMLEGKDPIGEDQWQVLMSSKEAFQKAFACMFAYFDPPRTEFPERRDHFVFIPMTPEVEAKYDKEARGISSGRKDENSSNAFMSKVRKAMNDLLPCQKCTVVLDLLKDGKKTVIYSSFKSSGIDIIKKLLDERNISYEMITGTTQKKARQEIVNRFNQKSRAQVLFITRAGGEGLDLKEVRQVVILEKGWNQAGDEQVIGRAIRFKSHSALPPQDRYVDVYHLVLIKPRDQYLANAVVSKMQDPAEAMKIQRTKTPDQRISADLYLMFLGIEKQKEIDQTIEWLKEVSIFNNDECMADFDYDVKGVVGTSVGNFTSSRRRRKKAPKTQV